MRKPGPLCIFVRNMLIKLQINGYFWKSIMHCDVISCVICIWNKVEYLEKEESLGNSAEEVICCHFNQSLKCNQE